MREPKDSEKKLFNSLVTHPLQSWEWGEFRKKTGIKVIRRIFFKGKNAARAFQLTIHNVPRTNYTIGYIPKGLMSNKEVVDELGEIGRKERCIFIKLEPNVEKAPNILSSSERKLGLIPQHPNINRSSHPLFANFTFQLDLTKSDEELLKAMHQKTRYNIRVAQKHRVTVEEDNSDKAFEEYINLMHETTKRQKYYAHNEEYHRLMWRTLKGSMTHLLVAKYKDRPLVAWIVFVFNNVIYYPYGASSNEHREVMASNLIMWEAIRFGKKMGCKTFDMWGSLGPTPDSKDPWYGFHRFKEGYGGRLVEFVGSYDLVLNPFLYQLYNLANRARWLYLRVKRI